MGCFPIHREESEESSGNAKGTRILGWTFRFVFSRRSKPAPQSSESSGESSSSAEIPKLQELRVFTLAELKAATKNFSLGKLGEGGFGAVYKGVIKDKLEKTLVAVKKLNVKGQQGQKEWVSEVTYLRMVDHPNLVKLLGFCLEDDERGSQCLLVYEFMPNRGLDSHIFSMDQVLSWDRRLQVALGTARGLAYLHEELKRHIVYRDLKAANILLDLEFNPKLSDFGLARGGPDMGATHVTTAPVGTPGYAAPEYLQTGRLSSKSDVWSFGMVLLELVTGRRALDMNRPRSERSLAEWVKPYANDNRRFRKLIDPRIRAQVAVEQAKSLVSLAQKCSNKAPKARPKMSEVVRQLEEIIRLGGAETHSKDEREQNKSGFADSVTDISATGSDLISACYESQETEGPVSDVATPKPDDEEGTENHTENHRSMPQEGEVRAPVSQENPSSKPDDEKGSEYPSSKPEEAEAAISDDPEAAISDGTENQSSELGAAEAAISDVAAESPTSKPDDEKGTENPSFKPEEPAAAVAENPSSKSGENPSSELEEAEAAVSDVAVEMKPDDEKGTENLSSQPEEAEAAISDVAAESPSSKPDDEKRTENPSSEPEQAEAAENPSSMPEYEKGTENSSFKPEDEDFKKESGKDSIGVDPGDQKQAH